MDLELPWQSRLDALLFWDLVRLRDDDAVRGAEVLVPVAPVDPGDPVARTAGDVEEVLVVRVAPGGSVRGERANFTRLVLGCIEVSKQASKVERSLSKKKEKRLRYPRATKCP